VDGFEHGRKFSFRIEIRGGSNANGSNYGWTQVGENVPEKVGAHHDIKPIRVPHKMCGQDIDMNWSVRISGNLAAIS